MLLDEGGERADGRERGEIQVEVGDVDARGLLDRGEQAHHGDGVETEAAGQQRRVGGERVVRQAGEELADHGRSSTVTHDG